MAEHQTQERNQNTIQMFLDRPKATAFLILGLVAIVAMITQEDPELLKYILGSCGSFAFIVALFVSNE